MHKMRHKQKFFFQLWRNYSDRPRNSNRKS